MADRIRAMNYLSSAERNEADAAQTSQSAKGRLPWLPRRSGSKGFLSPGTMFQAPCQCVLASAARESPRSMSDKTQRYGDDCES